MFKNYTDFIVENVNIDLLIFSALLSGRIISNAVQFAFLWEVTHFLSLRFDRKVPVNPNVSNMGNVPPSHIFVEPYALWEIDRTKIHPALPST